MNEPLQKYYEYLSARFEELNAKEDHELDNVDRSDLWRRQDELVRLLMFAEENNFVGELHPKFSQPLDTFIDLASPCMCVFTPRPNEDSVHYLRKCRVCGFEWWSHHCPCDGYQNICRECGERTPSYDQVDAAYNRKVQE